LLITQYNHHKPQRTTTQARSRTHTNGTTKRQARRQLDHRDKEKIVSRTRTTATARSDEETPGKAADDVIITPATRPRRSPTIAVPAAASAHEPGNHAGRTSTRHDERNTKTTMIQPDDMDDETKTKLDRNTGHKPVIQLRDDTGHDKPRQEEVTQRPTLEQCKAKTTNRNDMDTVNDPPLQTPRQNPTTPEKILLHLQPSAMLQALKIGAPLLPDKGQLQKKAQVVLFPPHRLSPQ